MSEEKNPRSYGNIVFTILTVVILVIIETLSYTVFRDTDSLKYLLRVISRGLMGTWTLLEAIILLITQSQYFFNKEITKGQRILCIILLGIVGIGTIVTALLGYGTNGDPRLIWWA